MKIEPAHRLDELPPYLFAEIDRKKKKLLDQGADLIDVGVGDPDQPAPQLIQDALTDALNRDEVHRYPLGRGRPDFRETISDWYQRKDGVSVDPEEEIGVLIGTKEGIGHLPLALCNPGDTVLVPDPLYPPYRSGTIFAGATPHYLPLLEKNDFLPDLSAIPGAVRERAKILFLNYPNNPTTAVAPLSFYENVVAFAKEYEILIACDSAYGSVYYDERPPSIFQVDGAKDVAVDFQSMSKMFNMTGWRVGWVAGHSGAVDALMNLKSNLDSGCFEAVQLASKKGLEDGDQAQKEIRDLYRERRDICLSALHEAGLDPIPPEATIYVWTPVPDDRDGVDFCTTLLEEAHVNTTPGIGFGDAGEGYFRISLTNTKDRLEEMGRRIVDVLA